MLNRAPAAARLLPLLLLVVTACPLRRSIADLKLQRRVMPGFEIELPSGEAQDSGAGYVEGRFRIARAGGVPAVVRIFWQRGGLENGAEIDVGAKILTAELGGTVRAVEKDLAVAVPESAPTRSWMLETSNATALTTEVVCGARRVEIFTCSGRDGVAALHRRIAASFRCRPDPMLEKSVGEIPVVFGVGAGWSRRRTRTRQVHLTDGQNNLSADAIAGADHNGDELVRRIRSSGAAPLARFGERAGDHWPVTIDTQGEHREGWLQLRPCPDRQLTLVLMWLTPKHDDLDSGLQTLRRARCQGLDEPAETWPTASSPSSGVNVR